MGWIDCGVRTFEVQCCFYLSFFHMLSRALCLDGVFLPLHHVGTAENQNINTLAKVSRDGKANDRRIISENIPVFNSSFKKWKQSIVDLWRAFTLVFTFVFLESDKVNSWRVFAPPFLKLFHLSEQTLSVFFFCCFSLCLQQSGKIHMWFTRCKL